MTQQPPAVDGWDNFYRKVKPLLMRYASRLGADPFEQEDLFHETLLRMWSAYRDDAAGIQQPVAFATLLNLKRSEGRRASLWQQVRSRIVGGTLDHGFVPIQLAQPGALGVSVGALVRALESLSDEEREAVILRVVLEKTEEESARVVGKSTETVRLRLNRGMRSLLEQLGGESGKHA